MLTFDKTNWQTIWNKLIIILKRYYNGRGLPGTWDWVDAVRFVSEFDKPKFRICVSLIWWVCVKVSEGSAGCCLHGFYIIQQHCSACSSASFSRLLPVRVLAHAEYILYGVCTLHKGHKSPLALSFSFSLCFSLSFSLSLFSLSGRPPWFVLCTLILTVKNYNFTLVYGIKPAS